MGALADMGVAAADVDSKVKLADDPAVAGDGVADADAKSDMGAAVADNEAADEGTESR